MGNKLTLDEAAKALHVNKRTIRRFIAAGDLRAYKLGNKLVRIDSDDLAALLRPVLHGELR